MLDIKPVELQGKHVRLVPLSRDYLPGLLEAVADGELWKLWYTAVPAPAGMGDEIDCRLRLQAVGRVAGVMHRASAAPLTHGPYANAVLLC